MGPQLRGQSAPMENGALFSGPQIRDSGRFGANGNRGNPGESAGTSGSEPGAPSPPPPPDKPSAEAPPLRMIPLPKTASRARLQAIDLAPWERSHGVPSPGSRLLRVSSLSRLAELREGVNDRVAPNSRGNERVVLS